MHASADMHGLLGGASLIMQYCGAKCKGAGRPMVDATPYAKCRSALHTGSCMTPRSDEAAWKPWSRSKFPAHLRSDLAACVLGCHAVVDIIPSPSPWVCVI